MPYTAPKVDANAFTMYDGPYAQALAGASQQAGPRGYLSMAALGNKVGGGQENYLRAMEASNANQLAGSDAESQMEIAKALLTYLPTAAGKGISSGVDIGQNKYIQTNRPQLEQADVINLDNTVSSSQQNRATAIGTMATAGYGPTPEEASLFLRPPVGEGYLKFNEYERPQDAISREELEIKRHQAESQRIEANKPSGGDGGPKVSYTYEGMVPGGATKTVKSDAPLDQNGLGFIAPRSLETPGVGGGRAGPAGGMTGVRVLGPNKPTKPAPAGKRYGFNRTTGNYYEYSVGSR
jgi:hypothetical protein